MKTVDQSISDYNTNNSIYELDNQFSEPIIEDENPKNDFIKNIFDEEGGFGESDCAGL